MFYVSFYVVLNFLNHCFEGCVRLSKHCNSTTSRHCTPFCAWKTTFLFDVICLVPIHNQADSLSKWKVGLAGEDLFCHLPLPGVESLSLLICLLAILHVVWLHCNSSNVMSSLCVTWHLLCCILHHDRQHVHTHTYKHNHQQEHTYTHTHTTCLAVTQTPNTIWGR